MNEDKYFNLYILVGMNNGKVLYSNQILDKEDITPLKNYKIISLVKQYEELASASNSINQIYLYQYDTKHLIFKEITHWQYNVM